MHRSEFNEQNTASTPKRRRLGGGGNIRKSLRTPKENNSVLGESLYRRQVKSLNELDIKRVTCESPPLPCNQVEYLYETTSCEQNSETLQSIENISCNNIIIKNPESTVTVFHDNEDYINEEMFQSKLELPETIVETNSKVIDLEIEQFKNNLENTFDQLNQSICTKIDNTNLNILCKKSDPFEQNIRETVDNIENRNNAILINGIDKHSKKKERSNGMRDNYFYGLPLMAKTLFKMYRNIDKFYDWQEECLNLDSLKNGQNLIYALPTSGGKTLVAEVLMLREVLCNHKNALFILPFVAIVQEKMWSLSPFAVQLNFLLEEYAGTKGIFPPMKRRNKKSIYMATIEKGLALIRSLIELNRLSEIGLIVVDELHLIGEQGRGATLETLLSTVIFINKGIQIVGMSATIGNLPELARFLKADVYQRDFRPVDLSEYVKLGNRLHRLHWTDTGLEVVPDRELNFEYSAAEQAMDPDHIAGLVAEVVPEDSCLIFCPTKKNCENVAQMLTRMLKNRQICNVSPAVERARSQLAEALRREGGHAQAQSARAGVGFHHAGLAAAERSLLEDAFRGGALSALCCTSTLAAGVNLPARRVLLRGARVGRAALGAAHYRQMAGRAGRAGLASLGESILVCSASEWADVQRELCGGAEAGEAGAGLRSAMGARELAALLLPSPAAPASRALLDVTLLAVQAHRLGIDLDRMYEEAISLLISSGAVKKKEDGSLVVSQLGKASIAGSMEFDTIRQFVSELRTFSSNAVLLDSLHLLYLVAPRERLTTLHLPTYYNMYNNLDEEGRLTAKAVGITERVAIRMVTGKPMTSATEDVLHRFYYALMLRDLSRDVSIPEVAEKYCISRGAAQSLQQAGRAAAARGARACGALAEAWAAGALLAALAARLAGGGALRRLPGVRRGRAEQLRRAGFAGLEHVARASADALRAAVPLLPRAAAAALVSAARMMVIEKVENLRSEAEDVMDDLNGKNIT